MAGPDFVTMSGFWPGTILATVAALRERPRTLPELALALQHGAVRAEAGDARRAGGWDVLAKWAVEDLGAQDAPGLTPDDDGNYSVNGEVWFTPGNGLERIPFAPVGQDPAERVIELPSVLIKNPFDPLHGRWKHNLPDRSVTPDRVNDIVASIQLRGWDETAGKILLDEHDTVIEGHARAEALDALGVDWRNDSRYFTRKTYGDTPEGNWNRIADAILRNGTSLSGKTRAAIATALTTAGAPTAKVAELVALSQRRVEAITTSARATLDDRRKTYARSLAADGLSQRAIAAEVERFYGKKVTAMTVGRWLSDGCNISADSTETLQPDPDPGPKAPSEKVAKALALLDRPEGATQDETRAASGLSHPNRDMTKYLEQFGEAAVPTGDKRDDAVVFRRGKVSERPPSSQKDKTVPAPSTAPVTEPVVEPVAEEPETEPRTCPTCGQPWP